MQHSQSHETLALFPRGGVYISSLGDGLLKFRLELDAITQVARSHPVDDHENFAEIVGLKAEGRRSAHVSAKLECCRLGAYHRSTCKPDAAQRLELAGCSNGLCAIVLECMYLQKEGQKGQPRCQTQQDCEIGVVTSSATTISVCSVSSSAMRTRLGSTASEASVSGVSSAP
jgi:hypothetical protein